MLKRLLKWMFPARDSYRVDGWEPPLDTEHFARDPQFPIEKMDREFRAHQNGDPTL